MNRTGLLLHYLVLVLILVAFGAGIHWDTKRTVDRMFQEQEQIKIEAWKAKLFPVYKELELEYESNPKTLVELLAPWFTGGLMTDVLGVLTDL